MQIKNIEEIEKPEVQKAIQESKKEKMAGFNVKIPDRLIVQFECLLAKMRQPNGNKMTKTEALTTAITEFCEKYEPDYPG